MQSDKLKNYFLLHLIVFIWGFTAVLGKLISIEALPLVWYRMSLAALCILLFIGIRKISLSVARRSLWIMVITGVIIALHWITFFGAIKVANVSVALATMATGAFFGSLLEPVWYGRKVIRYEVVFGLIVILGLYFIFDVGMEYAQGILLALASAFLGALFTLINGQLIRTHKPSVIGFYELLSGAVFVSVYLALSSGYTADFFVMSASDWLFILILASVCTAFAFIASVKVMRFVSPYTVLLTVNLEPVYGILLAYAIFGESERMNTQFYVGGLLILLTVVANGILKNRHTSKSTG
ncbi:EamA domain-containing membrane protein RarD [Muriicola jejuensis]|uniref:EamA family transporter n=1 Tax=Muriicola jejuensis TaxID=504488 RepID=A0A6P0UBQ1_9FLAO|nr:DMT family transporter [Muriicola jejuensis]NER09068.1 EamA family transporter [Muriicola jejuensis]SMP11465.1 EamA domain-containing membrane protein RarD [Muriicola jejuensis]